jgi:2-dehydropantoate 2-reductase
MATHTLVVGPGAIGCLFSSLLLRAGQKVSLLDRNPERAARIDRLGIRIEGQTDALPLHATSDANDIDAADLILFCVKSYDTLSAVRHMAPACLPGATLVSLQNGLGNLEHIHGELPSLHLIASATFHGASRLGDAYIRHAASGPTVLASTESTAQCHATVDFLNTAGIETEYFEHCASLLWSKLVISAAINPLTAIHGVCNGALLDDHTLNHEMHAAAIEASRVADALGHTLRYDDPGAEADRVCRLTGSNFSSMLQDIRRHHPTEIEVINGAIVAAAERRGLEVPVNRKLLEAIRALEQRPRA